jgi:hypothetical protein
MSKKTDNLLPEDFGKSFDETVFSSWKESINEHEKVSTITLILEVIGIAAIWFPGGLAGVGLFFVFFIISLCILLPKNNKRKGYQRQLGITNRDIVNAIEASKKRINN